MGWVKAKYVRRGEEVERVTQIGTKGTRIENKGAQIGTKGTRIENKGAQIGTKGTRIENKGAQIGIKGTPNCRQTSTLTKITQNINLTEIL